MRDLVKDLIYSLALLALFSACDRKPIETGTEVDVLHDGQLVYSDDFVDAGLSGQWHSQGNTWSIDQDAGRLTGAHAHNDALWLDFPLPEEVRVEFDAWSLTSVGDIKFEIFGDGQNHESGYVGIYGGWNNRVTCIARLDEHGEDRLDAPSHRPVETGQLYHFSVVRTDHRLQLYINDEAVLVFEDAEPLRGESHRYFAFNNWEAAVQFDNLRVYDLSQ